MQILVWKDKHGDYYYDASTPEAREASALQILSEWVSRQYIYKPEDPMKHIQYSGIDLEQAELTDEQIGALPTEKMRKEAVKHKSALIRRKKQYDSDLRNYERVQQILNGEKPLIGWRRRRSDWDDEKWQEVCDRLEEKFGDTEVRENVVYRPATAMDMLDHYEGEYTTITEETVWTVKQ